MAKQYEFNWQVPVPEALQNGCKFDKWDEDCVLSLCDLMETSVIHTHPGLYRDFSSAHETLAAGTEKQKIYWFAIDDTGEIEPNCLFKVDDQGFFVYYAPPNKETVVLELSYMSDIRTGIVPKNYTVDQQLSKRGTGPLIERSITLCSGTDLVNIQYRHIVAPDPATAQVWLEGLRKLNRNLKANHICPMTMLQKHWIRLVVGLNEKGKIPVRNITRTFASGKTEKRVFQCLNDLKLPHGKNDEIKPSDFTFDKFYNLYHKICPRTDITDLFKKIGNSKEFLTVTQFTKFLNDQRDPRLNEILFPAYTEKRVLGLIDKYETDSHHKQKGELTFDGLCRYLMSDDNAPVFLERLEIYQDMDQPLGHYFINSSHNTYLSGKQFGGKSSVEMYRQTMLAGCRCVELDIWDGKGEDQEPILTHGKAMCTDILFKDAIVALKDTAFAVTDMPVILSFENHCSKPQQQKMARYCEEIFGDLLLKAPYDEHPLKPGQPLPPPRALMRKILIKNKRLKPEVEKRGLEMLRQGQEAAVLNEDIEDEAGTRVDGEEMAAPPGENHLENGGVDTNGPERDQALPSVPGVVPPDPFNPEPGPAGSNPHPEQPFKAALHKTASAASISSDGPGLKPVRAFATQNSKTSVGPKSPPADTAPASSGGLDHLEDFLDADKSEEKGGKKVRFARLKLEKNIIANSRIFLGLSGDEAAAAASYQYTGATTSIHPHLSSMVNYAQPVKFAGFEVCKERNISYNMSSFAENHAVNLLKTSAVELVNYNKRQMSRIYPKGTRVDSTNYLPQIFWSAGCQMVALNFQTPDVGMQLNTGTFEFNGNCGYLLKPEFMRRPDRSFDPFSEASVDGVIAAYCSVQIISGQFLSDKKIGTFVEVEMYGLPTDTIRKEFRTEVIPNNGLNPVYNSRNFEFRKIVMPDLATLRFTVYDENSKVLGQRCLPFDALQSGYRHISLRTEANFPLSLPTIFCHIVLKTYVPEGMADFVDALFAPMALPKMEKKARAMDNMATPVDKDGLDQPSKERMDLEPKDTKAAGPRTIAAADQTAQLPKAVKKDETAIPAITVASLKKDKMFINLQKKHQQEAETQRKKHVKERQVIQKAQATATDRIVAPSTKAGKSGRAISSNVNGGSAPDNEQMQELKALVVVQSKEWTQLVREQLRQEHEIIKKHRTEQDNLLKQLLQEAQPQQLKDCEVKHVKENADLKSEQAKISMESANNVKGDKELSKGEKERRIKEINSNNTKRFIEERKRLMMRQDRENENLKKAQLEQAETVVRETDKLLRATDLAYADAQKFFLDETLV